MSAKVISPYVPGLIADRFDAEQISTEFHRIAEAFFAARWEWIDVSFQNSWVNYGTPYHDAQFTIDGNGLVRLRGVIKSGTITAIAFTLPAGYRPSNTMIFRAVSNGGHSQLDIGSNGTVTPQVGSNTWYSLDGTTFVAEQ